MYGSRFADLLSQGEAIEVHYLAKKFHLLSLLCLGDLVLCFFLQAYWTVTVHIVPRFLTRSGAMTSILEHLNTADS